MDTLYISRQQVYYLFADTSNTTLADIYNFNQMTYSSNALKAAVAVNFGALGVTEYIPDINDRYTLMLDFLNSSETDFLKGVANSFRQYLQIIGLNYTDSKSPFTIGVPHLTLEVIAQIVSSENFQEINREINASSSSTWRVLLENPS